MNYLRLLLASTALAMFFVVMTAPSVNAQASASGEETVGQAFQERFNGGRLAFTPRAGLSNYTLRVSGPDGYQGQVFSARVAPTFRLADHGSVPDGRYTYEITAATRERRTMANLPPAGADGRDGPAQAGFIGISQNGRFQVMNGRIVPFDDSVTED